MIVIVLPYGNIHVGPIYILFKLQIISLLALGTILV